MKDIHKETGELVFGTDSPTPEQRSAGQSVNFGALYGNGGDWRERLRALVQDDAKLPLVGVDYDDFSKMPLIPLKK